MCVCVCVVLCKHVCVTPIIWYRGEMSVYIRKRVGGRWGAGVVPWTQLWGVEHCFHVDKSEELSQLSYTVRRLITCL